MTELEFAQRLKQYRKAKGLTQQELADLLGVSNKSVSRWESGSYPDVATLAPLARALGVTINELLGESPNIRSLEKSDWQNWLSLAFSVGGGILFFLLILFTPLLVAYLLYLGTLVYGVYLQKHYTRPNRWFFRATALMNFFVNCVFLWQLILPLGVVAFSSTFQIIVNYLTGYAAQGTGAYLIRYFLFYAVYLLAAAGLTALTMYLIQKYSGLRYEPGCPFIQLERVPMDWRKWIPIGLMVLIAVFWSLYLFDGPRVLPVELYRLQDDCYGVLMLFCTVVCFITFNWKGHRGMLVPSLLLMAISTVVLPSLLNQDAVYSSGRDQIFSSTSDLYYRFGRPGVALYLALAFLTGLYLLCCRVRLKRSNITSL